MRFVPRACALVLARATACLACVVAVVPLAAAPLAAGQAPAPVRSAPAPLSLLLWQGDLPPGYVPDDALENADATARTAAYGGIVMSSSFVGYRRRDAAVVHYVALTRGRTEAALLLAHEREAVLRTRDAAPLTLGLAARAGDGAVLAYQARGARGGAWVMAAFSSGPYVTIVGAYAGADEQAALDLVRRFVAVAAARLQGAAARIPLHTPATKAPTRPALRVISLATTTRDRRATDAFRPHSPLYWRAVWQVTSPPHGARETLRETVWQGRKVLYSNSLADAPYNGDNEADDHLLLPGLAPGHYNVTVVVSMGRLSAYATHTFHVVAPRAKTRR